MKVGLIALLIVFATYEIIEHIIFPVWWTIRMRGRKSNFGPDSMIGRKCVVKQWDGQCGKVLVGSELWNAYGDMPMAPESEVIVRDIDGLALRVSPSD